MKYAIVDQSNPNAMRLQSIGWVLGTPSARVKEGDFLMWNFGGVYSVNKIVGETAKTITIETSPREKPAEVYTQKLFKSRLVCILEKTNTMSNRKYIHLEIIRFDYYYKLWVNSTPVTLGNSEIWINLAQPRKNLSLAICKELYPSHENDLHEKFLKDYISKLKDIDIVEENLDITEFSQYARDVIRIKQKAGVESIEDCLPFQTIPK